MRANTTGTSNGTSWRPAVAGIGAAPALGGICWALCAWEARRARRGPRPYEQALAADALLGAAEQTPVRITWMGDSLATGLGCDHVADTPAHLVARMLERAVDVRMLAVPGSRAGHVLTEQLPLVPADTDLVVLCVGANDVASSGSRRRFADELDRILAELAPTPVVLLSLPDMSIADRMAEPLRSLAGARARWFEAARARVAIRHGHVHSVDIASRPAGVSRRSARALLCADRFHPGAPGYRTWAERIAEACHHLLEAAPAPVSATGPA